MSNYNWANSLDLEKERLILWCDKNATLLFKASFFLRFQICKTLAFDLPSPLLDIESQFGCLSQKTKNTTENIFLYSLKTFVFSLYYTFFPAPTELIFGPRNEIVKICRVFNLDSRRLSRYDRRVLIWTVLDLLLFYVIISAFDNASKFIPLSLIFRANPFNMANMPIRSITTELLFVLWGFLLYFIIFTFIVRTISVVRFRSSAEFFCVLTVLRILVDLSQDDISTDYLKKSLLMSRIERLASVNLLIPLTYPFNGHRGKWVDEHFRKITQFIRTRKDWLYAPAETTLSDLRNDFFNLAVMYTKGLYGAFLYDHLETEHPEKNKSILLNFLQLIGFLLPLLLIATLLLWSNPPEFIRSNYQGFTLIFISWLLIGVDVFFKLGILARVIEFAKGLRDLR